MAEASVLSRNRNRGSSFEHGLRPSPTAAGPPPGYTAGEKLGPSSMPTGPMAAPRRIQGDDSPAWRRNKQPNQHTYGDHAIFGDYYTGRHYFGRAQCLDKKRADSLQLAPAELARAPPPPRRITEDIIFGDDRAPGQIKAGRRAVKPHPGPKTYESGSSRKRVGGMATNLAEVDEVVFSSNTDGSSVVDLRGVKEFCGAQGRTTAEMNRLLDWAHSPPRTASHTVPRDSLGCDSRRTNDRAQPLLLDRPAEDRTFGRRKQFQPELTHVAGRASGQRSEGNILAHFS